MTIDEARDSALDLIAINAREHLVLCNPATPERDSLAEDLLALTAHGVPREVIGALLQRLGEALDLNRLEGTGERALAGTLDRFCQQAEAALGVKALARALRPHLRAIADGAERSELLAALRAVDRLAAAQTLDRLRSVALRHELRTGLHDLLLTLIEGQD